MKKSGIKSVLFGVFVFTVVALIIWGTLLQRYTLVDWWLPVVGGLVLAAIVTMSLYRRFARHGSSAASFLSVMAFAFAILYSGFYSINYYGASADSTVRIDVSVIAKHREERYRTRRLNRHASTRGAKYYVYVVDLELPDGRVKSLEVPLDEYNCIRNGSTRQVNFRRGAFGIQVFSLHEF